MKKNFKFMLVGLLAMIGMNAFAIIDETGRSVNDVVYQLETLADGTKIAYVTQVNPSQTDDNAVKSLSIVKEVAGEHGTYKVVGIIAGWETAGKDVSTITETLSIDASNFDVDAYAYLSNDFTDLQKLKNLTIIDNGKGTDDPSKYALQVFPDFYDETIVETVVLTTCEALTFVPYQNFQNGKLKSIALPASIEYISDEAFDGCEDLTTVNFPDALTYIGKRAFRNTAITAADLTKTGITKIETSAFQGSKLTSFIVPKAVTKVKYAAFKDCSNLATVTFEEDGPAITDIEGHAFSYTKIATIKVLQGNIAESAFEYCTKLKTFEYVNPDADNINPLYYDLDDTTPETPATDDVINPEAFKGCIPTVTIYTPKEYIANWQEYFGKVVPTNCKWEEKAAPVQVDGTIAFNAGGFAKWYNDGKNIMVDATKYKAFSVSVDNGSKNGDGTAYFTGLKKYDQRYYIYAGEHVIFQKIVTDEEDPASAGVEYEEMGAVPGYSVLEDDIFTFDADTKVSEWHKGSAVGVSLPWWLGPVYWETDQYLYRLTANNGVGFRVFTGTTMKGGCDATGDCENAQFFIQSVRVPDAAGRLAVVWLDENGNEIKGNTTAIESVKTSVEDGAVYNLAGQKVNANYKGVVIKNGKKYMK
jgi:hypothetical protein